MNPRSPAAPPMACRSFQRDGIRQRIAPVILACALSISLQGVCAAAPRLSGGSRISSSGSVLVGTWEADVEHSTFKGRLPYRSGRMRMTVEGKQLVVSLDVVTASGAKFHIEYRDALDGKPVPVVGDPYYDTESTVFSGRLQAVRTEFRRGRVTGHTQFAVAKDGSSFIASSSRSTPEDGHLYESVIRWKRLAH